MSREEQESDSDAVMDSPLSPFSPETTSGDGKHTLVQCGTIITQLLFSKIHTTIAMAAECHLTQLSFMKYSIACMAFRCHSCRLYRQDISSNGIGRANSLTPKQNINLV